MGLRMVATSLPVCSRSLCSMTPRLDTLGFTKYHRPGSGHLLPDPVSPSCMKILAQHFNFLIAVNCQTEQGHMDWNELRLCARSPGNYACVLRTIKMNYQPRGSWRTDIITNFFNMPKKCSNDDAKKGKTGRASRHTIHQTNGLKALLQACRWRNLGMKWMT